MLVALLQLVLLLHACVHGAGEKEQIQWGVLFHDEDSTDLFEALIRPSSARLPSIPEEEEEISALGHVLRQVKQLLTWQGHSGKKFHLRIQNDDTKKKDCTGILTRSVFIFFAALIVTRLAMH